MSKDRSVMWFSVMGCLMSILFLWAINQMTSPDTTWYVVPSLFLLFWPAVLIFAYRRQYAYFALFGSGLFIALLITINWMYSPDSLWFPYAIYPFLWWPLSVFSGRWAGTVSFAWIGALTTIAYYAVLNASLSPGYPWAIYPAYGVLLWPLALHYSRKRDYFGLSVVISLLSIIFFVAANIVSSPDAVWAIYPIFGMLWWPLSMYYFYHQRRSKVE